MNDHRNTDGKRLRRNDTGMVRFSRAWMLECAAVKFGKLSDWRATKQTPL
jgi:hypothetical protein